MCLHNVTLFINFHTSLKNKTKQNKNKTKQSKTKQNKQTKTKNKKTNKTKQQIKIEIFAITDGVLCRQKWRGFKPEWMNAIES